MKNKKTRTTCLLIVATILLALSQTTTAAPAGDLQIINFNGVAQTFSYTYIESLPKTYVESDLYCFGLWVTGGNWEGVKLSDLLISSGIDLASIGSTQLIASDGYQVNLDTPTTLRPDVIVAYEKDDIPLSETYRLVYPDANGAFWISSIISITFSQSLIEGSHTGQGTNPPQVTQNPNNNQPITSTPTKINHPTPVPAPTNTSITKPINPPTITPNPTTTINTPNENTVFPVEIIYIASVAVVATLVAASFVMIRRRVHQV